MSGPLAGVRVLDFSRVIAGPFCTQQLADLGAEIIKLETIDGGDDSRSTKPPEVGGEGHFYLAFNRGKKSVALDVRTPAGRDIVERLAAHSDVLVQNFRPGVMERLGFGYEAMHERFPRLVYLSVSAYGQTGPMADRPGYDPVLQAESGMMMLTGEPDGPPLRHPLSIIDSVTAFYATTAVLAALHARHATGRGQHIDLSLHDAAVAMLSNAAQYYFASGELPPRTGNRHMVGTPVGLFETKTGPIYLATANDRLFRHLCRAVLERPGLAEDPRFARAPARKENRVALYAELDAAFMEQPREVWVERARKAGVPLGPVRTIAECLESPEVAARGMVTTAAHPTAGEIRMLGSPLRFSDTPVADPVAPPLLGEHTEAVLREMLGLDEAELARLRNAKVIGSPDP